MENDKETKEILKDIARLGFMQYTLLQTLNNTTNLLICTRLVNGIREDKTLAYNEKIRELKKIKKLYESHKKVMSSFRDEELQIKRRYLLDIPKDILEDLETIEFLERKSRLARDNNKKV